MDDATALRRLADLPGVAAAVDAARQACTELRWHQALRRRTAEARAETTARAARASAALDGAELPVDLVRDVLRGARPAPDDAVGRTVAGAVRAVDLAQSTGDVVRSAPLQALARLHTAAAAGLVPDEALGRPRQGAEQPLDLPGPGAAPRGTELADRLSGVSAVLSAPGEVPALLVAAIAHGELLTIRPFVAGNGVVARAVFRAVVVQRGLDPTGVAIPESALAASGLPPYVSALRGYASGTPDGVAQWLVGCADAVRRGAGYGVEVADAVLAGRLT
ncbi:Fic family protein [Angustibacter luteus]|uniref:Fido domain-containing protein n=1 Tax=Angustibacter luteus TaxID=658456 RepID=A0ABW1JCK4_9ACTN